MRRARAIGEAKVQPPAGKPNNPNVTDLEKIPREPNPRPVGVHQTGLPRTLPQPSSYAESLNFRQPRVPAEVTLLGIFRLLAKS